MLKNQDKRTDLYGVIVTLLAWALISALLFARAWRLWGKGPTEVSLMAFCALNAGFILTVIFVSLPFRILQNVIRPERRRTRIWETIVCILTVLVLACLGYILIVTYPANW